MEANQTAKMVTWLDEERRKDKALITKLEDRVGSQNALIEDQTRRLAALESELTGLKTKYATVQFVDESSTRLRNELTSSLEQAEARRSSTSQELKKMRDADRDSLQKAINDLRQEMLTRIERELQPRRAEEERLSRVAFELQNYADNLSKSFEEFEHTLGFLEEQRRSDARRITELTESLKKYDAFESKIDLLEGLSRRNERTVSEVSESIDQVKQERRDWLEQNAIVDQQREQLVDEMKRRIDSFVEEMEAQARLVENWSETHRLMKKHVDDFERLVDRVDRRVNEVSEVQRLSEDRFRREWEEFLQEDQRRLRQFTLTNEEAWRENEKLLEDLQSRMAQSSEKIQSLLENVQLLRQFQRTYLRALSEHIQANVEDFDDAAASLPSLS